MAKEYAKHEREFIEKYEEKGYDRSYRLRKGKLTDLITQSAYEPKDIYVVAEHRFEGMSNPSDMSILYVLETKDGSKGTLLLGYGPSGDLELIDFFKAIPKDHFSNKANIIEEP